MIGSTEERKKTVARFGQEEESKGTIANRDVFEAEALSWYSKTWCKEADASRRAKGNRN